MATKNVGQRADMFSIQWHRSWGRGQLLLAHEARGQQYNSYHLLPPPGSEEHVVRTIARLHERAYNRANTLDAQFSSNWRRKMA